MKDIYGDEVEIGKSVEIFKGHHTDALKPLGIFKVRKPSGLFETGDFVFESALFIAFEKDLNRFGLKTRLVVQCTGCEEFFGKDEVGECSICGNPVCENCQQPFQGPPHPAVDYCVHSCCYEDQIEEDFYDYDDREEIKKNLCYGKRRF